MTHDTRRHTLKQWLLERFDEHGELSVVSGDASFRRYFRLSPQHECNREHGKTWVLMDAPPEHEDTRPFVHIARLMAEAGVQVPRIIAQDETLGFVALSDFGDITYSAHLASHPQTADTLYRQAINALITLQRNANPKSLNPYNEERLIHEMRLFPDWYLAHHLKVEWDDAMLANIFSTIATRTAAQPKAFVHRDYHSRNLMALITTNPLGEDTLSEDSPGLLDFQDALHGPLSYDLVSLLRDAYIDWPEEQTLDWAIRYWEGARKAGLPLSDDFGAFYIDYEWMGLQRHIKVLGIFARLYHRDGKARYLADLPRVFRYALMVARRYRELSPLAKFLERLEEQALGGKLTQECYTF